jgi:catechol 2,3-dioxygenase-like lactoylglutathione lyase family enzyme
MDVSPAIVSPVMRLIGVADVARSVLFYRDVLGFEVRESGSEIEVVNGPACIRLGADDYAPDNWDAPRPRGSVMLFFETDDLSAIHAMICGRGGNPSDIEKVNWIKMQMFQIRDPDGHMLWFGQSYDQPVPPAPPPMLHKALPELPFDDVGAAVAYYPVETPKARER